MTFSVLKYYSVDEVKKVRWTGHLICIGDKRNV